MSITQAVVEKTNLKANKGEKVRAEENRLSDPVIRGFAICGPHVVADHKV